MLSSVKGERNLNHPCSLMRHELMLGGVVHHAIIENERTCFAALYFP